MSGLMGFLGGFGQGMSEGMKLVYLQNAEKERMQMLRQQQLEDKATDRENKLADTEAERKWQTEKADTQYSRDITAKQMDRDMQHQDRLDELTQADKFATGRAGIEHGYKMDELGFQGKNSLEVAKIKSGDENYKNELAYNAKMQRNITYIDNAIIKDQKSLADPKLSNTERARIESHIADMTSRRDNMLTGGYDFNTGSISSNTPDISSPLGGKPTQYDNDIIDASQKNNIDPNFTKAIVKVESNFNPDAVSKTGVGGLMQVTKGTSSDIGIDASTPKGSIDAGTKYIAGFYNKDYADIKNMEDRLKFAAQTYSSGPGTIAEAREMAQSYGKNPNSFNDVKEFVPEAFNRMKQQGKIPKAGQVDAAYADKVWNVYQDYASVGHVPEDVGAKMVSDIAKSNTPDVSYTKQLAPFVAAANNQSETSLGKSDPTTVVDEFTRHELYNAMVTSGIPIEEAMAKATSNSLRKENGKLVLGQQIIEPVINKEEPKPTTKAPATSSSNKWSVRDYG